MNRTKLFVVGLIFSLVTAGIPSTIMAKQFFVGGRTLNLLGYFTQEASFSIASGEHYDTEDDLQGLLFNAFIEADYSFSDDLTAYVAGMWTMDFVYDLKHDDQTWNDRQFTKSRRNLYKDDESWQILKEANLKWTPGPFLFKAGKQIVSWGEMMGFRLMDQINPLDKRRGSADVEFETTIIPIWLLRAEYWPTVDLGWMRDVGFEFIFNPNADFIPDQSLLGNDEAGIWSPNIELSLPVAPGVFIPARVGSVRMNIDEPDEWDDEGFEYAFRLKLTVWETVATLNYFYGISNASVTLTDVTAPPIPPEPATDGSLILHSNFVGTYPRFRFVGLTLSRDLYFIRSNFLGGVAPVVFLEAFYGFDNTFATAINTLEKCDELRWAVAADWSFRVNFLNPRAFFDTNIQYYHQRIYDYPSGYDLKTEDDNYMWSFQIKTTYWHAKIVPSFFILQDINNKAEQIKVQILYDHSNKWHYALGALFFNGDEHGHSLDVFDNKDYIFFKISYRWG